MDPQATLYALLDGVEHNDAAAMRENAHSLVKWLQGGGFAPIYPDNVRLEKRLSDWWRCGCRILISTNGIMDENGRIYYWRRLTKQEIAQLA